MMVQISGQATSSGQTTSKMTQVLTKKKFGLIWILTKVKSVSEE